MARHSSHPVNNIASSNPFFLPLKKKKKEEFEEAIHASCTRAKKPVFLTTKFPFLKPRSRPNPS
jgi:hypothetical protein